MHSFCEAKRLVEHLTGGIDSGSAALRATSALLHRFLTEEFYIAIRSTINNKGVLWTPLLFIGGEGGIDSNFG